MLPPSISKNDRLAHTAIIAVSAVVFIAVVLLKQVQVPVDPSFDVHVFARVNAIINSLVSVMLVAGLMAVKGGRYLLHKRLMGSAIVLSVLFLLSYIAHHLLSGDTKYGGEGPIRYIYFVILISHIFLAAVILPFILYTSYRALVAEWPAHRRLAKFTWPVWFYVSVTGVIVYWMISPYYS